ncbi:MAG: M20/M25/M40 family metallo-hydrolase [Bacteroidales bacterium]
MEEELLGVEAVDLLKSMVKIPSYSFEEEERANFLFSYLTNRAAKISSDITVKRIKNNIVMYNRNFYSNKETLMLCSHIDTVKELDSYTFNPFGGIEKDEIIYGLGTNDDGASVVSQIETFFYFNSINFSEDNISVNLLLVLTAEEERSGSKGMDLVMQALADSYVTNTYNKKISLYPHFAIVGEPTAMDVAIAERGLLVLDGEAYGISGHAARNEGINALYIALNDINTLRNYKFKRYSNLMGEVKLTITQLNCGQAHNVIPDRALFVIDIRPTEQYSNIEILELLQKEVKSNLRARNLTNRTSFTPKGHRLITVIDKLRIKSYVSPTTSDWMRLSIPAIKMGPGESARSHSIDEFVKKSEIKAGIEGYIKFIENI